MIKKLIISILIISLAILVITGCKGLVPGEGEGEGEPEIQQVVLVELYIAEGCPSCSVVEPIFEGLANEYSREEMILVEIALGGNHHTTETRQRFDWYALTPAGVPQMMFNGLNDSHVGVLDESTIRDKIETQMAIYPVVELQASRKTDNSGTVFSGTVKNIGNSTLTSLVVNGMAFIDRGKMGFRYSVVDIFEDEKVTISSLSPGQEYNFTITVEGLDWDGDNLDGVIFVQSVIHPDKAVKQSVFLN